MPLGKVPPLKSVRFISFIRFIKLSVAYHMPLGRVLAPRLVRFIKLSAVYHMPLGGVLAPYQ